MDTVLLDFPPARTEKCGHLKKHGDRLVLEEIPLSKLKIVNWLVGVCPVITKLWKDKDIYAVVHSIKKCKGKLTFVFVYKRSTRNPF